MRPVIVTKTAAGSTTPIYLDNYISPFNVGFGVVVSGAAVTFTVEHTFDNVQDASITPTWFPHSTVVAVSANTDGNYAFPVTAIRLTVTVGGGTATMTAIQAGLAGG